MAYQGGESGSGRWWSTSTSSGTNTYFLYVDSSLLIPQNDTTKDYGFSLRCISQFFNTSFVESITIYRSYSTGSTKARRYPLSYIYSGFYWYGDGNLYRQDLGGFWWSTTVSSDTDTYGLIIYGSELDPRHSYGNTANLALRYAVQNSFQKS